MEIEKSIQEQLEMTFKSLCTLNLFITKPARWQAIKGDLLSAGVTTERFICLFTLLHRFFKKLY